MTAFTDTGLHGNTTYVYRVDVVTNLGEETQSGMLEGMFHELVAQWPLALEEGDFVRLYWEEAGNLAALGQDEPHGS